MEGAICWEKRFLLMQQHSGEHIVSGIINRRFGFHNTGFHISTDVITIDFDGVIPPSALPELEEAANAALWQDLPVRCWYPSPQELPQVPYRTKKALPWPVRVVEVPGYDLCACCGTHVKTTGEIGLIKLFSAIPFRGGTRMEMACGRQALDALNRCYAQNKLVSQAFSAQLTETGAAAQRMNQVVADLKYQLTGLQRRIFASIAEDCRDRGNVVRFEAHLDSAALRELADAVADTCGGTACLFSGTDEAGYGYCLASRREDLRPLGKKMTQTLKGRGGGKPNFQQGRVQAPRCQIEGFFGEWL